MTAKFPNDVYIGRLTENLPGIVYDENDKVNFFSEDFQNLIAEISALETYCRSIFAGGDLVFENVGASALGWNGKPHVYASYGGLMFTGNGVAFNNLYGSWSFALDINNGVCIGGAYAMQHTPPANGLAVAGDSGFGTYTPSHKVDVVGNIRTSGEFLGARLTIQSGDTSSTASSRYLKGGHNGIQTTSTLGWVMPRAGSLLSIGVSFTVASARAGDTCKFSWRINGTDAFFTSDVSLASTGDKKTYIAVARNTAGATFVAGDVITGYITFSSGSTATAGSIQMLGEVQFDS